MTSSEVLDLYNWFKENGITVWIDGGWCIDALLGQQTRDHQDLDIAVQRKDNTKLRQLLEGSGYKEESCDDSSEFMYVMKSDAGQSIDVHAFEYDESGKNIYGVKYPFGSLTGKGKINGQGVNCIDPEWMFKFKTSYEPDENDYHDVKLLCEKFNIPLPDVYKKFEEKE